MQNKVTLVNSNQVWNSQRRYKINNVVNYVGFIYQNSTGKNSNPTLGIDWQVIKKIDAIPVIYYQDFVDSGSHQFTVTDGILVQNAFLNGAQVSPFTQVGTLVTVTNSVTNDLVTLTGRN